MPLPNEQERQDYLNKKMLEEQKELVDLTDLQFKQLVKLTDGMSQRGFRIYLDCKDIFSAISDMAKLTEQLQTMSLNKLRTATMFKAVDSIEGKRMYTPDSTGEVMTYRDIPKESLLRPRMSLDDIIEAIKITKTKVDPAMILALEGTSNI